MLSGKLYKDTVTSLFLSLFIRNHVDFFILLNIQRKSMYVCKRISIHVVTLFMRFFVPTDGQSSQLIFIQVTGALQRDYNNIAPWFPSSRLTVCPSIRVCLLPA